MSTTVQAGPMRAAVFHDYDVAPVIEEVVPTDLEPDEVLVAVAGVGICHTDLTAIDGTVPLPTPFVVGHEGSGVIEAVGSDVVDLAVGDRVVLTFDHCRECASCRSGHPAYCELFAALNYFGTRLDGSATLRTGEEDVHGSWFGQSSFGTHAVASARNAVKVDDDLPIEILGPLGCGLLTGAGAVLNVHRPREGQSIGIWGIGTVGLSAVMAAKAAGCDPIIAVDPNTERLEVARKLGATHTFDPTATDDVVWEIMELTGGLDFTIDAVGSGLVVRQALESLRSPGSCATLGLQKLENEITIDQGHLLLGRTLTGVIEGDADPHRFIPELIGLWREGKFPFDTLITTYRFDDIATALSDLRAGTSIKPVLVPSTSDEEDTRS